MRLAIICAATIVVYACLIQSTSARRSSNRNHENRDEGRERRYRRCHELVEANKHEIQDCARIGSTLWFVVKNKGSWNDACRKCQEFGGYLAPIKNFREYQLLVSFASSTYSPAFWMGGKRREGNWVWIEDNEPMWYNQWLPNFPTNQDNCECVAAESVAELSAQTNGLAPTYVGWGDFDCNHHYSALCKISRDHDGRRINC